MGGGPDFCLANVGITGGYECIVICKPDMSAAASNGFHEMVMVCFPMVDINSSVFLTKLSMYSVAGISNTPAFALCFCAAWPGGHGVLWYEAQCCSLLVSAICLLPWEAGRDVGRVSQLSSQRFGFSSFRGVYNKPLWLVIIPIIRTRVLSVAEFLSLTKWCQDEFLRYIITSKISKMSSSKTWKSTQKW